MIPIDECSLGTHSCDPNAECIDLLEGYTCECQSGFFGDDQVCMGALGGCVHVV